MHWLNFSGERLLPSMPKLLDQPFWLDPSDRHHMAAAIQFLTSPRDYNYWVASGDPRHLLVRREYVWARAVHRVAVEGVSPEQAVDEAIVRIKQILNGSAPGLMAPLALPRNSRGRRAHMPRRDQSVALAQQRYRVYALD
jgi:hypothetical protein